MVDGCLAETFGDLYHGHDPHLATAPEVCPVYQDLTKLCPLFLSVGGDEVLLEDTELLVRKFAEDHT